MKIWKVILATIVIFVAGAFAGGMLVRTFGTTMPYFLTQQFFKERLKKELHLSAEQTKHIDKIFTESGANMKILWDLIGPEVEAEKRDVRDKIRKELTAEQREKFEQLLKQPPHRPDGPRRQRSGTNSTNSVKLAPTNNAAL